MDPSSDAIGHLGWYLNPRNGIYSRSGGHFVTLEGADKKANRDTIFSFHDPSPRSNNKIVQAKLTKLRASPNQPLSPGILKNPNNGATTTAANHLRIDGIVPRAGTKVGLLDGLLQFKIEPNRSAKKS